MKKILTIIVLALPILVVMGIALAWQSIKNPSLNNENKKQPMLAQNQIKNGDKKPSNGNIEPYQLMDNQGKKPVNEDNNKSLLKPEQGQNDQKLTEKKNKPKISVKSPESSEKRANYPPDHQVKSVKKPPIHQPSNNELTENNHPQESTDDAPIPALW